MIVIGNVGLLPSGILLIPDAKPDDGLLDVLVASPRTVRDWVRLTAQVLTRRERGDDQLDRLTGRRVEITVEPRDQYQLDGDTAGECAHPGGRDRARRPPVRVPAIQRRSPDHRRATELSTLEKTEASEPRPGEPAPSPACRDRACPSQRSRVDRA